MAVRQNPEHNIEIVPVASEERLRPQNAGSEDRSGTLPLTSDTPLLGKRNSISSLGCSVKTKSRFKCRQRFLCSSKAAILILVWNLIVSASLVSLLDPSLYIVYSARIQADTVHFNPDGNTVMISLGAMYSFTAILFFFYPMAGCLADTRFGRYKTVVNSISYIFCGLVSMTVIIALGLSGAIPLIIENRYIYGTDFHLYSTQTVSTSIVIGIVFGIPILFGVILLLCSLVAFSANVIQFGMDQLHDAPADDSVLYIHWYVWTLSWFTCFQNTLGGSVLLCTCLLSSHSLCSSTLSWNHFVHT